MSPLAKIKNYIPVLSVRPAELSALKELPEAIKSEILPHILLKPWLGSSEIARSLDRVSAAFPNRPFILEYDQNFTPDASDEKHASFLKLSVESGSCDAWRNIFNKTPFAIPAIQMTKNEALMECQVTEFILLGRGVVARMNGNSSEFYADLDKLFHFIPNDYQQYIIIIIDFGSVNGSILNSAFTAVRQLEYIKTRKPLITVAVSCTSFPSSFKGLTIQSIFERQFYDLVRSNLPSANFLIYSDRGSARIHEGKTGGFAPPRMDLSTDSQWSFFRSQIGRAEYMSLESFDKLEIFQDLAKEAMQSSFWDDKLNIWGTQKIKITALGSDYGINTLQKNTAARINVHLYRQACIASSLDLYDLQEDKWID